MKTMYKIPLTIIVFLVAGVIFLMIGDAFEYSEHVKKLISMKGGLIAVYFFLFYFLKKETKYPCCGSVQKVIVSLLFTALPLLVYELIFYKQIFEKDIGITTVGYIVIFFIAFFYKKNEIENMIGYQRESIEMDEVYNKNLELSREVELFNIEEIGKKYEVLGFIQSSRNDEKSAQNSLMEQAIDLGANAIIKYTKTIDNNTSGYVSTSILSYFTNISHVHGETTTDTTYHLSGTAVKILE